MKAQLLRRLIVSALLGSVAGVALAAEKKAKTTAKRAPSPSLAKIEDEPGLPRVMLIGDSISMGYTLDVRAKLKGKANVYRIPTNGGPTVNGLPHLKEWLADHTWEALHLNL